MTLEKIFETNEFTIWKDDKGYDFAYGIENKTNKEITIQYGYYDDEIKVQNWIGLFSNEKDIIDNILNGKYEVL